MAGMNWKKFWELINQKRLENGVANLRSAGAVSYIIKRFYAPHWPRLFGLLIITTVLSFSQFFYAWCARYAADDVVQVKMLAEAAVPSVDPVLPNESRNFIIPSDERHDTSWSQRWEGYLGKTNSQRTRNLIFLLIVAMSWVTMDFLGNYFHGRWIVQVGQKVQYRMRHRVYDTLQALPMEYHDSQSVGSMLTSLFSDINIIQTNVALIQRQFTFNVCSIIIGASILLWLNAGLAVLTFLAFPFYVIVYRWFRSRLGVVHDNLRYQQGSLNSHMTNRVKNFYLVKSYVNETGETRDFFSRSRKIISNSIGANILGSTFTIICGIISGMSMVVILYRGTTAVRNGEMTPGDLLMFYTSAGLLFNPVSMLSAVLSQYHVLSSRCAKIRCVLTEPFKVSSPAEPAPVPTAAPEVIFKNVSMKYHSSTRNAIDDVSFNLPAGKKLCVMGSSGAGKSTLAKLAARIYDPTHGRVLLDSTDITDFKVSELREVVGYVNQEPVIFGGTLRENIRYGTTNADEHQIISAARRAQIHEYIITLPERYQTTTAERGQTLSGGQKQRVNIARVLLNGPQFLILDDCTSALDAETEARLIREFDAILNDRTAIIISHRLAMALCCDYVLILDDGRLVEMDSLNNLLERDGSHLKTMLDEQVQRAAKTVFDDRPKASASVIA